MCVLICVFKLALWENDFFTHVTLKGHFSSMSSHVFFKLLFTEKCFSQTSHWKGVSPVCVFMCILKLDWWVNVLLQISHWQIILEWDVFKEEFWSADSLKRLHSFLLSSHELKCVSKSVFYQKFLYSKYHENFIIASYKQMIPSSTAPK